MMRASMIVILAGFVTLACSSRASDPPGPGYGKKPIGSAGQDTPPDDPGDPKYDAPGDTGDPGNPGDPDPNDPAQGDTGDEGEPCGGTTCGIDESCCGDNYCFPSNCTDCCGPAAGGGGAGGSSGGGSGGTSAGGSSGSGGTSPGGWCTNQCGSPQPQGPGCYCDVLCLTNLDCCPDFFTSCF